MRKHLEQVGITTDDRPVVASVFWLYDERGLPFDVIFESLLSKGLQPCWMSLIAEAEQAGWSYHKASTAIVSGLWDAGYGLMAKRVETVLEAGA